MWGIPSITFVNGTILGADGANADSIRIRGGLVDRLGGPPAMNDIVVDLDGAVVSPGLINAHDHLELNSFPRLKWREHHANVCEWIADFQPRFGVDPQLSAARPDTLDDRVWVGGLKNMLSGVTTLCHHNALHRPLRSRFPVRIVRRFGISHSLGIDGPRVANAYRETPPHWPWIIHAAEGIDAAAAREIRTLCDMGCIGSNTVIVHGVAIEPRDAECLIANGAALVWCPTSNEFLFGRTADVRRFHEAGRLAIGTDSRLSGAGDLLDELRAAATTGQLSAVALFQAVTTGAAAILRLPCAGRLEPGVLADLTIVRGGAADPYETLVSATRADVRLTMIGGAAMVAVPEFAAAFGGHHHAFTRARVNGQARIVASWIARRASRLELTEPGFEIES